MSSDGSYPTRASRRAEREPQTSRASAGTAAAILILAAILGFGGGALAGNSGGDDEPNTAATTDPGAVAAAESEEEPEEAEETEATSSVTLTSPEDGGTVAGGDQINFEGRIEPAVPGVTLTVERSLDGGENWETFGSSGPITANTRDDGSYSTHVFSQREGPNHFRMVGQGPDGWLESNDIVVTIN